MAVRTAISYIAEFIRADLGIATWIPTDVASASTEIRVMRPEIFDPGGGTVMVGDSVITYTGINGDQLTGVPNTGTGSIAATLQDVNDAAASQLYIPQIITSSELEDLIDDTRYWVDAELLTQDVERRRYYARAGWFGLSSESEVELRDDRDASFSTVTPDDVNERRGEFLFDSSRTESGLFVAGFRYNPFYAAAEIISMIYADDRRFTYYQMGQVAVSKRDLVGIAQNYRWRGHKLSQYVSRETERNIIR